MHHTSFPNNLDGLNRIILSNNTPFRASNPSSPSGVFPPYSATRNCLISSFVRMAFSSSPLLNCSWYARCGARVRTRSSRDWYWRVGGTKGTQTVKTCEMRSGCQRAMR